MPNERQTQQMWVSRARRLGFPRSLGARQTPEEVRSLRLWIRTAESNAVSIFSFPPPQLVRNNGYSGDFVFQVRAPVNRIDLMVFHSYAVQFETMIQNMINYVIGAMYLRPSDHLQVVFKYGDPQSGYNHISTPRIVKVKDIKPLDIVELAERLLQSKEEIDLSHVTVTITYMRRQVGSGYLTHAASIEEFVKKKTCILEIKSRAGRKDCFYQCLAITLSENKLLRRNCYQKQRELHADLLRTRFHEYHHMDGVHLNDLDVQEAMWSICIHVIHALSLRFLRKSKAKHKKHMFLLFVPQDGEEMTGHFHLVTTEKVGSLWDMRKFCYNCMKGYQDVQHACIVKCPRCRSPNCVGVSRPVEEACVLCPQCHLMYFDEICLRQHMKVCKNQTKCEECFEIYKRKDKHVCGTYFCRSCRQRYDRREQHICWITKPDQQIRTRDLLFYDYECYVNENKEHVPYLIVTHFLDETKVWYSEQAFLEYVLQPQHKGITCIAHNGGRYDIHFVKKYLLKQGIKSKDIVHGRSIFCITIKGLDIRFIDSYRFIPVGIRSFPSTFGLRELSKGYFPYRFLSEQTLDYVGPMPGLEWFDFDQLKHKEREQALQWYSEVKDTTIDLRQLCTEYCISDVLLLQQGCEAFRESYLKLGYDDPFAFITIASVAMHSFRKHFLVDPVAVYNPDLTRPRYGEHFRKVTGLLSLTNQVVEGRLCHCVAENEIWMVVDCLDNGCTKCYGRFTMHPFQKQPMHALHNDLQRWLHEVRKDYEVHLVWTCEFQGQIELYDGIHIRDAFYGGRTETIQMYTRHDPIDYYDVTSMYPYVLQGIALDGTVMKYPTGAPLVIYEPEDWTVYFGFIRCRVLPPPDLYLPILPCRREGKLMFTLEEQEGTWTTEEVRFAVSHGYRVRDVRAVVHYTQTSSRLFRGYIYQWYKLKIIAGGWAKIGNVDRLAFLHGLSERYGIDLQVSDIPEDTNAGLYAVAKLMLNSLWGKFAQDDNYPDSKDVFNEEEFWEIVENDQFEVNSVILHDTIARTLVVRKKHKFAKLPVFSNVAIAAYTTSYARIELYKTLAVLQRNVLYMDTDSVIFKRVPGIDIPTGPYLGELTSELKPSDYIVEFVSGGPKSYAYRTKNGVSVIKIKGFTLNYEAQTSLNFERMVEMVFHGGDETIARMQFQIAPTHEIRTTYEQPRRFQVTHNKRKLSLISADHIKTEPFAYV